MKPPIYTLSLWLLLLVAFLARPAVATAQTPQTLAEAVAANKPLAAAVEKAGLMPLLSNKGPYTLLVPSASALQQLNQMEAGQIREVLLSHVLEGRHLAADFKDGATLTTLSKQTLKVCRKKNKLMLNGMLLSNTDQTAGNGVMHTVSGLLVTPVLNASLL